MKGNKALVIAMCFAVLIIMSVVYAAFTNSLSITAKSNAIGTMGGVTQTISCDAGTPGVSGANAPVATEDDVTINATLYQPGDEITCTITYTNNNAFRVVAPEGTTGCDSVDGSITSPIRIVITKFASGATLPAGGSKTVPVKISYMSYTVQNDPVAKNASVTCNVNWVQG